MNKTSNNVLPYELYIPKAEHAGNDNDGDDDSKITTTKQLQQQQQQEN